MQDAARLVTNLQTESDGVDLVTLLRETPREAYSFQQLGVSGLIGAPDDTRTLIDRLNHPFHSFSIQPRSIPPSPTLDPHAEPTFLTVDPPQPLPLWDRPRLRQGTKTRRHLRVQWLRPRNNPVL